MDYLNINWINDNDYWKQKLSKETILLIEIVYSMKSKFLDGYYFDDKNIEVKKHRADLVTQFDNEIEHNLITLFNEQLPLFNIIGEESFDKSMVGKDIEFDNTLIIDPIDGTMNFIHQLPLVSISVGMVKNGELFAGVIFNPVSGEFFYAEKDKGAFLNGIEINVTSKELKDSLSFIQPSNSAHIRVFNNIENKISKYCLTTRSFRSTAIELAYVACGRGGLMMFHRVNVWDLIAGVIIIKEAGGSYINFDGDPINLNLLELTGGILGSRKIINSIKKDFL